MHLDLSTGARKLKVCANITSHLSGCKIYYLRYKNHAARKLKDHKNEGTYI